MNSSDGRLGLRHRALNAGSRGVVLQPARTPDLTCKAALANKLGFHPGFGLTVALPELIGKNNAELIFYTNRRVTGEQAYRMGLANILVPQDQVRSEAEKLANEIAECSPLGPISTRATMRTGLADRIDNATEHELKEQTWLRSTEDFEKASRRRPSAEGQCSEDADPKTQAA